MRTSCILLTVWTKTKKQQLTALLCLRQLTLNFLAEKRAGEKEGGVIAWKVDGPRGGLAVGRGEAGTGPLWVSGCGAVHRRGGGAEEESRCNPALALLMASVPEPVIYRSQPVFGMCAFCACEWKRVDCTHEWSLSRCCHYTSFVPRVTLLSPFIVCVCIV